MESWIPSLAKKQDILTALLVAAAGIVALRAFYQAFSSKWPENYFGGTNGVDPVISRSPVRYLCFRALPVFVASYSSGVAADRLNSDRDVAIIAVCAGYALISSVPSIWKALRGGVPRLGLVAYRVGGFVVTGIAAVVAIALGDRLDSYVPSGPDVAFAFWIAVATVATGHWSRSLMAKRQDAHELLARARQEVDEALLLPLRDSTYPSKAALYATAYTEHLNRPKWVRSLERFILRSNGSYGIMQMQSKTPLTDAESVSEFLEALPSYPRIVADDPDSYRRFFLHHNSDTSFADLASEFYWILHYEFHEDEKS